MGLQWIRLDNGLFSSPKVLQLTSSNRHSAVMVYVFGLCYAGQHGTDGFIPTAALPIIHGKPKDATALVEVALWHPCMGGWQINGWAEYQLTSKDHEERKTSLRRASAKGNCIRHHGPDCGCWAR